MMVFKRKQVVVLSLVLMLVVAGYLQYSYNSSSESVSSKEPNNIGEAVYVDNKDLISGEQKNDTSKQEQNSAKEQKQSKTSNASKEANDYFSQVKMDREIARSKDAEAMKQITQDTASSKELKAKANEKMLKIVDSSQKEVRLESLIKEKGFEDVIAMLGDDGSIDIVVKTPSLSSIQTAQIADIASRQANVDIGKVHIRSKY